MSIRIAALPPVELFTIATRGYAAFVLNLRASLQPLGFGDALRVYALDAGVHAELVREGVNCIRWTADLPALADFGSNAFARTMAFKYAVALDILASDRCAFYVDSDIVFLRDPSAHIGEVLGGAAADLAMQIEAPLQIFNAGFWLARPTRAVTDLFAELSGSLASSAEYVDDQRTINRWIRDERRVSAVALDAELFACGNQFLPGVTVEQGGVHIDRTHRPFPYGRAYILHFNFLTTKAQKVTAMFNQGAAFHDSLRAELPLMKRFTIRKRSRR